MKLHLVAANPRVTETLDYLQRHLCALRRLTPLSRSTTVRWISSHKGEVNQADGQNISQKPNGRDGICLSPKGVPDHDSLKRGS